MLRIVADTNTVVSALLWRGAPHRLFEMTETAEISFYTSRALVEELAEVLTHRKLTRAVKAAPIRPQPSLHRHGNRRPPGTRH